MSARKASGEENRTRLEENGRDIQPKAWLMTSDGFEINVKWSDSFIIVGYVNVVIVRFALPVSAYIATPSRIQMSQDRLEGLASQFAELSATPKPASAFTAASNAAVAEALPLSDSQDFLDALQGLIERATLPIKAEAGNIVWDMGKYEFIEQLGDAPSSVNPSLWRQARLNNIAGLFKVTERVYQTRSMDLSNMSFIEGATGVIVVDPTV